jgi:dihydropteroate synthase
MKYKILKFENLQDAENKINEINANPTGAKIMALKAIQLSVKFKDVETKTANLIKQEMLSRGGDVAVS